MMMTASCAATTSSSRPLALGVLGAALVAVVAAVVMVSGLRPCQSLVVSGLRPGCQSLAPRLRLLLGPALATHLGLGLPLGTFQCKVQLVPWAPIQPVTWLVLQLSTPGLLS